MVSNHGNGCFNKWVNERCGFTHTTAYNAISASMTFKCSKHYLEHFDASAMYVLSADSTPEKATLAVQ